MKKLMFACAAVLAAVCANAGTVDWKSAAVYHGNTTDTIAEGSLGYLIAGGTQAAIYEALAGVGATDAATWISENAIAGLDKTATSAGKFAVNTDVSYASGTYDFFAVVFDTTSITDASKVYVSQAYSGGEVPGSGGLTVNFTSGLLSDAKTAAGWQQVGAIPEPTSGLLLLLGVAGLALRRRRA